MSRRRLRRRRLGAVLLAALVTFTLVAAGCSSSGEDTGVRADAPTASERPGSTDGSSADERSTTTTRDRAFAAYRDRGPHPVGVHTVALADGRRVVVWYPAGAAGRGQPKEIFDIASLLSPELQSQIPAELRPRYQIDAHPGAAPATDGPFPVVLFSHGLAGFPEQSADLTTHLASWGFVVVAPDHVERSLSGLLGTAARGVEPLTDPVVLSQALDAAIADAQAPRSPLHELMDTGAVAVVGHSAGAGAAYREASAEPRIKAFIAYSIGDGDRSGLRSEAPPVPQVPGMVMVATADGIIPADASRQVYEAMEPPKYLVQIADAGHLVFSDICLIGRDQGGLVALVSQAGLDLDEDLLRLTNDGCGPDALDPATAFPAIDHLSVAFLRHALGVDEKPVGLDPEVTETFADAKVTLTVDAG